MQTPATSGFRPGARPPRVLAVFPSREGAAARVPALKVWTVGEPNQHRAAGGVTDGEVLAVLLEGMGAALYGAGSWKTRFSVKRE